MAQIELDNHLRQRSALLGQERTHRRDHAFKESMSPTAQKAASIVARIRKEESELFWTSANTSYNKDVHPTVFPGMPFAVSRNRLENTALWKIVAAMPKGCLLHAHMEAMIDIDWMLDQALEIPGFWMSSPETLDPEDKTFFQLFDFHYLPQTPIPTSVASIWQAGYTPNNLVPFAEAARSFPGGIAGFKAWAVARMSITETEALDHHHHGINDIWRKFTVCFRGIVGLFYTEPIFRRCIPRLLHQLHQDNIKYVELRLVPGSNFKREGSDEREPTFDYFFQCFQEELEAYCASPQGAGFWGARIIWTTIRGMPDAAIRESVEKCLFFKEKYPAIIAGFDFVGQEDLGRPLIDLLPHCQWIQQECARRNIQLPFFFHAGECLGDGDTTDGNLVDAILLGSRRIGHAFSLYKHPLLIERVKQQKILIEMCPISHEVLRLTENILTHPMPALQARGVAVSLNNDDPAILGHGGNGLSHEFFQVLTAFGNTGLGGVAAMAEDSVRWAAFEDEEESVWLEGVDGRRDGIKAERVKEWRDAFETWCAWIVEEYAEKV